MAEDNDCQKLATANMVIQKVIAYVIVSHFGITQIVNTDIGPKFQQPNLVFCEGILIAVTSLYLLGSSKRNTFIQY